MLLIYKISKKFPKEELFSLTTQIRRSAISITSNIAEGFSRQSLKEKVQFYSIALGSLTETRSQLILAKDLSYLTPAEFDEINECSTKASKILHGLIKKSKSYLNSQQT